MQAKLSFEQMKEAKKKNQTTKANNFLALTFLYVVV